MRSASNLPNRVRALPLSLALMAVCAGGACGSDEAPRAVEVVDPVYRPGQEWSFDARRGEEGATLIVLRTDDVEGARVVHVALRGLRVRSPQAPGGFTSEVGHMPLARSALEASGAVLVHEQVPLPPYEDGYAEWAAARGGVWSVPVAQAVSAVEAALAGSR